MTVFLQVMDGVAIVTINNPPVNALGHAVRTRLLEVAHAIEGDSAVRAVVLTGAGRLFAGGADISEFDRPPEAPQLPEVLAQIEASTKPWVAAVHGNALGGGFELALACHYRVAARGTRFGLPEVNLGIIPGAGGTQRLPRIIGAEAALPVIAEKRLLDEAEALALGILVHVSDGTLVDDARALALDAAEKALPPLSRNRPVTDPGDAFWHAAEARIGKGSKGIAAPLLALAALRFGILHGFTAGLAHERETYLQLRAGAESAALRYLFFAERSAPRPASLRGLEPVPLRRVGVVGGGTMGVGIAAALRAVGYPVVLAERDDASAAHAMTSLKSVLDASAKRGVMTAQEAAAQLGGVESSASLAAMADCDLVIEAVVEDLDVKRRVFAELARICCDNAILATNTSYIDPRRIAEGLAGPDRFIGMHFFNPAHIMKLLEIIPLPTTSPAVLATGFALAAKLGKVPVRSGICDGFIGNRILRRYRAEAEAMVRDGIAISDVDAAMRRFGCAMGPFEMQDLAGLDIAFTQRETARTEGQPIPETLGDIIVRAGRKGQKSGGGWYDYAPGERTPQPSPNVTLLLRPVCAAQKDGDPDEIAERLVSALAAEGKDILAEGIASRPEDIDLVAVHGYGFPRARGGPMFMARQQNKA